jgi:excisionase family DNA binding protein
LVSTGDAPVRPVPQQFLTVREVAKLLNVATSTVYKLCAEGELAHVRVSNAIRVRPSAVEAWLSTAGRRGTPTSGR